jgi:hypothetical protein
MKIIMQYLLPRKIYTIFFVCIALVGTGFTIHEGMGRKTYRDCGIVKEKLVIPGGYKASGKTVMGIQFEKTGFKAIDVDETTYLKHRAGDRVCFNLLAEDTTLEALWILFKLASCLTLLGYILVSVAMYLNDYH